MLFGARMAQPWQHLPIKSRECDIRWRADVQVLVQRALAVVRHQDLHLTFGQVLDLFVLGPVLPFLPLRRAHSLLEPLETEELLANQGLRPARDRMFRRCADEISRRLLILGAQRDLRIRRRRHILLESLADLEQLRAGSASKTEMPCSFRGRC